MTPKDYMRMKAQETFDYYRSDPSRRAVSGGGVCTNLTPGGQRCAASRLAAEYGVYLTPEQPGWPALRSTGIVPPIPGLPDGLVHDLLAWHDIGPGETWSGTFPKGVSAERILAKIDSGAYGDPAVPAPQVSIQPRPTDGLSVLELVVFGAVGSQTPYATWDEALRAGAAAFASAEETEAAILHLIECNVLKEVTRGRLRLVKGGQA